MKPVRTPFPTTCYSGPEYFCDSYREMLTKPQWNLLKAMAREGVVYPATVLCSLKSLQKMELAHRETDGEGNSYYGIYDILFRRWIDKKTL